MTINATAPARIDLAGGTLDIWPLYLLHPGSVTVNLAISLTARAEVRPRAKGLLIESADRGLSVEGDTPADLVASEPRLALAARLIERIAPGRPLALHLAAGAPAHAGLGGSSTLAIAAAAALDRFAGSPLDHERLLALAQDVETAVIAVPTGQQDYLPALYGGLQALHWQAGGLERERLSSRDLAPRLVLGYTGAPRFSGANNWEVFKRRIDGDREIGRRLDAIRDAARDLRAALVASDFAAAAAAINREWEERRLLTPGISTPEIDRLAAATRAAGASAFKVCGAGGGGSVVALVEPGARSGVEQAIRAGGGEVLSFTADEHGLVVHESEASRPLAAGAEKP